MSILAEQGGYSEVWIIHMDKVETLIPILPKSQGKGGEGAGVETLCRNCYTVANSAHRVLAEGVVSVHAKPRVGATVNLDNKIKSKASDWGEV